MKESGQENQSSVENLQSQDQEPPSSKNRELRSINESPDFIEVGMGKFKITRLVNIIPSKS